LQCFEEASKIMGAGANGIWLLAFLGEVYQEESGRWNDALFCELAVFEDGVGAEGAA
jgi:hypothetical protein